MIHSHPIRRWQQAAALVCLLVTAACGGGRTTPPSYVDPHPLPEEPLVFAMPTIGAYGGRFVHSSTNNPRTFNALMANETSSTDITNHLLFAAMTRFNNSTQRLEPSVATRWEQSADGLTWTFHLRRGARFSDGQPMTAADILFAFEVVYDPTVHPVAQDSVMMGGKPWTVSAPDPFTVVITTPSRNAIVPELVHEIYVMPKHILEPVFRSGGFAAAYAVNTAPDQIVTSGPFRVMQYSPNERVVLTRNPYWFGIDADKKRLPYLDELVFNVVPDQDAAHLRFQSGGIDGLDRPKPENYAWYAANQSPSTFTLHELGPELNSQMFWFNLNKVRQASGGKRVGDAHVGAVKYSWFSNVVFRRAMSMAVDREAMIKSIYFGDAVKNWSTTTESNKVWNTPDIVKNDFNPDEARRLLASLNWRDRDGDGILEDTAGNTVSFSLKTNGDNRIRVAMANFIRDDLARVGIRVILTPVDFNTLVTNFREDFQYEAGLLGLQTGIPPDPSTGQNVWRSSGITHWWNIRQPKPETPQEARIDALMDLMVGTSVLAERQAAWRETQNIVNEQSWFGWLPTQIAKLPVSNRFGNTEPSVIPPRLLWNIDRVYVKSRAGQN